MTLEQERLIIRQFLDELSQRCPRLIESCYWAGTSAISLEELNHRRSFDIDLHTKEALVDVRPFLRELEQAFASRLKVTAMPGGARSGFRAIVILDNGETITLEVLSNFETVENDQLVASTLASKMKRVSLAKYLTDKIQCLVDRTEARDLVDIAAVLAARPEHETLACKLIAQQDYAMLVERLLGWSDDSLQADLEAYDDVDWRTAAKMRDKILSWVQRAL
jgi:hypothetical protein